MSIGAYKVRLFPFAAVCQRKNGIRHVIGMDAHRSVLNYYCRCPVFSSKDKFKVLSQLSSFGGREVPGSALGHTEIPLSGVKYGRRCLLVAFACLAFKFQLELDQAFHAID
ncbi:hypothetical protein ES703_113069 [subsurface metagenome]